MHLTETSASLQTISREPSLSMPTVCGHVRMKVFSERERERVTERGAEALICVFPDHSPHSSWQVGDVVGLNVQLGEVP